MTARAPATDRDAAAALAAWDLGAAPRLARFGGGLINDTFAVESSAGRFVLQRVHPIFAPEIHHNIVAVTERLAAHGLATPRLRTTRRGEPYAVVDDAVWRLQSRLPGRSHDALTDPAQAATAASLLARFHGALDGIGHRFVGLRTGVHDTPAHLARLRDAVADLPAHRLHDDVARLAEEIFARADTLVSLRALPDRIVHGDPKLNNFLFSASGEATALIDLDTVGPMPLALELGDAWRSWCNRSGEDDAEARFDLAIFEASLRGYASASTLSLSEAEHAALVSGVEWITLELAARFAADALRESYFGWDRRRFERPGEHNLLRARGQWSLHAAVVATRAERTRLVDELVPSA